MDESIKMSVDDFRSSLFGDEYHADTRDEAEEVSAESETEGAEDQGSDVTDVPEEGSVEESGAEDTDHSDEEKEGAESSTADGQKFKIKVNHEWMEIDASEATPYIQKGFDYDRVKEQAGQYKRESDEWKTKYNELARKLQDYEMFDLVSEATGVPLSQIGESLYVNNRKNGGLSEDAAREEIKRRKAEKELAAYKAESSQKEQEPESEEKRAERDLLEFRKEYPDTELTRELVDKLIPDVRGGMSLTSAYRKYEKAQDSARIADLERQIAAQKQNSKNRRNSPGGQTDSGSRRGRNDVAEFRKALFG